MSGFRGHQDRPHLTYPNFSQFSDCNLWWVPVMLSTSPDIGLSFTSVSMTIVAPVVVLLGWVRTEPNLLEEVCKFGPNLFSLWVSKYLHHRHMWHSICRHQVCFSFFFFFFLVQISKCLALNSVCQSNLAAIWETFHRLELVSLLLLLLLLVLGVWRRF